MTATSLAVSDSGRPCKIVQSSEKIVNNALEWFSKQRLLHGGSVSFSQPRRAREPCRAALCA